MSFGAKLPVGFSKSSISAYSKRPLANKSCLNLMASLLLTSTSCIKARLGIWAVAGAFLALLINFCLFFSINSKVVVLSSNKDFTLALLSTIFASLALTSCFCSSSSVEANKSSLYLTIIVVLAFAFTKAVSDIKNSLTLIVFFKDIPALEKINKKANKKVNKIRASVAFLLIYPVLFLS